MSDEEADRLALEILVLRAATHDREAITKLAERFDAPMRYYIRRLLGRDERVPDVAQEVWLGVIRQLPRLRNPSSFIPWFYRIARNAAIQQIRGASRVRLLATEDVPEVAVEAEDTFSSEDAVAVHQAMDRLSEEHREVLTLRFIEDQSYEQIASIIGCSVGTVRSRLFYAKRALRGRMELSHERP